MKLFAIKDTKEEEMFPEAWVSAGRMLGGWKGEYVPHGVFFGFCLPWFRHREIHHFDLGVDRVSVTVPKVMFSVRRSQNRWIARFHAWRYILG